MRLPCLPRRPAAKTAGLTSGSLAAAMRRLFATGKIWNEPCGKPSRPQYRIGLKVCNAVQRTTSKGHGAKRATHIALHALHLLALHAVTRLLHGRCTLSY
jgi:hypothetical protein